LIDGHEVVKVIVVPRRLVNVVIRWPRISLCNLCVLCVSVV